MSTLGIIDSSLDVFEVAIYWYNSSISIKQEKYLWNLALWDVAFAGCWAGTHFSLPFSQVHGSGQVCLGSGGSQSWPSDMDSRKLAFMSHTLRLALFDPQGAIPSQALILLGRTIYCMAPEAPLFRRMPTRPKAFLQMLDMSGLRSCTWTHLKNGLVPHFSVSWSVQYKKIK